MTEQGWPAVYSGPAQGWSLDPRDYVGEVVTVGRHRPAEETTFSVCGRDGCASLVASDQSHRGDVHWDNYDGRHRWNVRRHRAVRRVS